MGSADVHLLPRRTRVGMTTFALCLWLVGCGGIPTSDPPDFLPTPEVSEIGVSPEAVSSGGPDDKPIELTGDKGAVDPDAELWIVNLDRKALKPLVVKPMANGSFSASVEAKVGERVRLVSRTDERHSLPLDLEAVRGSDVTALSPLQDQGLDCLTITPRDELDLGEARTRKASFAIENRCTAQLTIESASLRFDTNNLELMAKTSVAANESAQLTLNLAGELSEELWDIVLLEVTADGARGRYALSVWAR